MNVVFAYFESLFFNIISKNAKISLLGTFIVNIDIIIFAYLNKPACYRIVSVLSFLHSYFLYSFSFWSQFQSHRLRNRSMIPRKTKLQRNSNHDPQEDQKYKETLIMIPRKTKLQRNSNHEPRIDRATK